MLKQTADGNRTIFLKLFTQELVFNSKPKVERIKGVGNLKPEELAGVGEEKEIRARKAEEQKTIKEISELTEQKTIKEISELTKPIEQEKFMPSILPYEPTLKVEAIKPSAIPVKKQARKIMGPLRPITKPLESMREYAPAVSTTISPLKFTMPISSPPEIGGEVNLGKLSMFLLDNAVTEVECHGPDRFILVKKAGQVNLTRITLSQEEINDIIKSFSEKARIPVISGVFKTSVENLTITAIISEFVGSRFIIYKSSPYSILEQQNRQIRQAQLQGKLLYSRRLTPQF